MSHRIALCSVAQVSNINQYSVDLYSTVWYVALQISLVKHSEIYVNSSCLIMRCMSSVQGALWRRLISHHTYSLSLYLFFFFFSLSFSLSLSLSLSHTHTHKHCMLNFMSNRFHLNKSCSTFSLQMDEQGTSETL